MRYAATRGPALYNTLNAVKNREPFNAGNLTGFSGLVGSGYLPSELRDLFTLDQPTYVVMSYGTPIAWWSPTGGWRVPNVTYSVTTTSHQSTVRRALHGVDYTRPEPYRPPYGITSPTRYVFA